ncbi:hypothetical protein HYS93_01115 [Candidatus Daviesbacteria bacterium]|nr:hypothetical protein [Candidatus Daviesbacteria bacterium]
MSNTTQEHLNIKEIKNDLVVLKDGSVAVILQTSAVNFDLLSENEQLAIIATFAALLNSLSFPIQIVIRSKRLDISNYLKILAKAQSKQANPLLKQMIERYRVFVETIIRENEVLDKQFFVVITVSYLELGIINDINKHFQKALTILIPRRDHIIRQLGRIGLKAAQLNTENLIKLFYDIYNGSPVQNIITAQDAQQADLTKPTQPANDQILLMKQDQQQTTTNAPIPQALQKPQAVTQVQNQPAIIPQATAPTRPISPQPSYPTSNSPFVVEELPDDYGTV